MPVWLLLTLIAAVVAAAVAQLVIPMIAARRIGAQLTALGGEATVTVEAMPALQLLRGGGDRLIVDGRGVEVGMSKDGSGLSSLEGFNEVTIRLADFRTGPFEIRSFELARSGPGPYRMRSTATSSGATLLDYGSAQIGIGAVSLGAIARQAPLGGVEFPIEVEVELASSDGRVSVTSGEGTIAGYPTGPIAASIAAAVARRLELDY